MTDRAVLEEIKEKVKYLQGDLLNNELNWLIKQAERVQELESEIRALRAVARSNKFIGEQYLEQNKRYREAIESMKSEIKYALYSNKSEDVKRHYLQNAEREATEALEGEGE